MNNTKPSTKSTQFNWGTGIVIAIVLFVCTTLGVVGYLISLDYHVVAENYYEKAENYQQHIERVEHSGAMNEPVEISLAADKKTVAITFPASGSFNNISGTVELYRPSDSSLDKSLKLELDENRTQHINTTDLLQGKWVVKLNWSADSKKYYIQKSIFL